MIAFTEAPNFVPGSLIDTKDTKVGKKGMVLVYAELMASGRDIIDVK